MHNIKCRRSGFDGITWLYSVYPAKPTPFVSSGCDVFAIALKDATYFEKKTLLKPYPALTNSLRSRVGKRAYDKAILEFCSG
jgi:hypothetical protein